LTNVIWTDLGGYDVLVSNSAGSVTSACAWLRLATRRWSDLVYFGASEGQAICGDMAWPAILARRLGIPLRDYAQGAASSADNRRKIAQYLGSYAPRTNTLIAANQGGGGNDLVNRVEVQQAVSNGVANLRLLVEAGARELLIPKLPSLNYAPGAMEVFPWMTDELVLRFNALMDEGLERLKSEYPLTIYRPDWWALWDAIWENPVAYGFTTPLQSPYPEVYCDGAHLMPATHLILSHECYRVLMPTRLHIDSALRTGEGALALSWSGGLPPFLAQRSTDLRPSGWQPAGPLSVLSSATVKPQGAQEFFRVIFLGQ
jgi:hypothetical protein